MARSSASWAGSVADLGTPESISTAAGSVARPRHHRPGLARLRAPAGTSSVRRRHRVRPHAADLAPRPTPEARSPRRPLRSPSRPAPAAGHALPRRLAADRTRPRSNRRIEPTRATPPLRSRPPAPPGGAVDARRSSTRHRPSPDHPHAPHATKRTGNVRRELIASHHNPVLATSRTPFVVESRSSRTIRPNRQVLTDAKWRRVDDRATSGLGDPTGRRPPIIPIIDRR